ncbi:PadR family transcriptional regulator [Stackebrandtia nassauensis]|nr:PadR family transcriptional regulator [Stackebrandtia nassauensis]
MTTPPRRSALALTVLVFLAWESMHAYKIQQLIKEFGKDRVVNVKQRASVYQTIDRLLRTELIRVRETSSADNRPERTIYEITDTGRDTARRWLREALASTGNEYPEFPAALAQLPLLPPSEVAEQLQVRLDAQRAEYAQMSEWFDQDPPQLHRLFLIEEEYRFAVLTAEIGWLESTIADLRSGALTWDETWLRQQAQPYSSENPDTNP